MPVVLDASAMMAVILVEPGRELVAAQLPDAVIGTVNWSEVVAKLVSQHWAPEDALDAVESLGTSVVTFDQQLARTAALLINPTRHLGLSFGDRACLALAQALHLPVLTADRSWARLQIGVEVRLVR
ncbi:MAG: type II toxin-antitoxin system VapC family toxin [Terriglobales bacterium]